MTGAAGQGQSEVTSVMSRQEQGPPTNELEWREELARAAFFIIYYQSSIPAKKDLFQMEKIYHQIPSLYMGSTAFKLRRVGTQQKNLLYITLT